MSAKTTAQARNGPSRPDDFFLSKSASGMNSAARAPPPSRLRIASGHGRLRNDSNSAPDLKTA